jgi:hypothetical protein
LTGGTDAEGTADFVSMFDKFFDCLNVSNFSNWARARKPYQRPYTNSEDVRLQWLEEDFLGYLDLWEKSVEERPGFDNQQKKRMLLSAETLLGIRLTVKSFVEFVRYLFSLKEVENLSFLSNNICQDPLECFFGRQRQRGGTNDNPTVVEFLNNTQALQVVDSFCRGPVKGNCRGGTANKKRQITEEDCAPLTRRKRARNAHQQST